MKLFVGVTGGDWYEVVAGQAVTEARDFSQPGGSHQVDAATLGGLLQFTPYLPLAIHPSGRRADEMTLARRGKTVTSVGVHDSGDPC